MTIPVVRLLLIGLREPKETLPWVHLQNLVCKNTNFLKAKTADFLKGDEILEECAAAGLQADLYQCCRQDLKTIVWELKGASSQQSVMKQALQCNASNPNLGYEACRASTPPKELKRAPRAVDEIMALLMPSELPVIPWASKPARPCQNPHPERDDGITGCYHSPLNVQ